MTILESLTNMRFGVLKCVLRLLLLHISIFQATKMQFRNPQARYTVLLCVWNENFFGVLSRGDKNIIILMESETILVELRTVKQTLKLFIECVSLCLLLRDRVGSGKTSTPVPVGLRHENSETEAAGQGRQLV